MKTPAHPTIDVRSYAAEVRMVTTGGKRSVEGYAAVFNSRSEVLHTDWGMPFVEEIRPGTFTKSVAEADVRCLFNHDDRYILGRRGAGTLDLSEDSTGLHFRATLGGRSYERDLEESLERRDVFGSSFSFATVEDAWDDGPEGVAVRSLKSVHLFDVGPVVFPAYRAATATCRSLKRIEEARAAKGALPPAADLSALIAMSNQFYRDQIG